MVMKKGHKCHILLGNSIVISNNVWQIVHEYFIVMSFDMIFIHQQQKISLSQI